MAWKNRSTSSSATVDVEIDLEDFDEGQLLQGLIEAGWISQSEAEAIEARAGAKGTSFAVAVNFDGDYLDHARRAVRRGDRHDAIHYIEHFLGREWIGVLQ